MKRKRKLKLHEQPGLALRAKFLCNVCTDTLLLYLASPSSKATRTLRSLILAEVLYRINPHDPDRPQMPLGMRDPGMYVEAWKAVFGDVPMSPGFGAASEYFPHDRLWAELDRNPLVERLQ